MDTVTPEAPELPPADSPNRRAPADPVAEFRSRIVDRLTYEVGKDPETASERDWFVAIALATRDGVVDGWIECNREAVRTGVKRVYYLSLEFLIGRLLFDALGNLGILELAREALSGLGVDLDRVRLQEPDAGLGNGGLGSNPSPLCLTKTTFLLVGASGMGRHAKPCLFLFSKL